MKFIPIFLVFLALFSLSNAASVLYMWSGAITDTSAVVKVRVDSGSNIELQVSKDSFNSSIVLNTTNTAVNLVEFNINGLIADSTYNYRVSIDGALQNQVGRFYTVLINQAYNYTFAFSSCAKTGSNNAVFDNINSRNPKFFLHMGDFHYENIDKNDPALYRGAFDKVFSSSSKQKSLFQNTPLAYVWDDHDFGSNNADGTNPGKQAVRDVYRQWVPHYPVLADVNGNGTIQQTFWVGRVKFILTDCRSARDPTSKKDDANKTMLGLEQRAWLINEFNNSRGVPLVVWVSSVPWISLKGGEGWGSYSAERTILANAMNSFGLTMMIYAGDAHMIAMDDGTNNKYSTDNTAYSFPVIQSAALDRPGSVKGGPYFFGCHAGPGAFTHATVIDNGLNICVNFSQIVDNKQKFFYNSCVSTTGMAPGGCRNPLENYYIIGVLIGLFVIILVIVLVVYISCKTCLKD